MTTDKGPFFAAQIGEALAEAHIRSQSPWLSRNDAAAYAACPHIHEHP